MAKVKFVLNTKGLTELMQSPAMLARVDLVANTIAQRAGGEGYAVEKAHPITFTSIASVKTSTFKSRLDNSKNNTLEKAIGSTGCRRRSK